MAFYWETSLYLGQSYFILGQSSPMTFAGWSFDGRNHITIIEIGGLKDLHSKSFEKYELSLSRKIRWLGSVSQICLRHGFLSISWLSTKKSYFTLFADPLGIAVYFIRFSNKCIINTRLSWVLDYPLDWTAILNYN